MIKGGRGRPIKLPNKVDRRSDSKKLQDMKDRFDILNMLTHGVCDGIVRSVIVAGAPGVGKSYTVHNILSTVQSERYTVVHGAISPIQLYMLAYKHRHQNNIIVLDDADTIFSDEDGINLLKQMCDSSDNRRLSYMKEAWQLREEGIPLQFDFNGGVIAISNTNWQAFIDHGKNKLVPHFEAMMSRSMYLDLMLHSRSEIMLWIEHIAKVGKIFRKNGISASLGAQIIKFMKEHQNKFRVLSIRELNKVIQLSQLHDNWQMAARVLLTSN